MILQGELTMETETMTSLAGLPTLGVVTDTEDLLEMKEELVAETQARKFL